MPPTSDRLLADKTLERLRAVSVATVTMQLLKRGLRHTFIQGPQPLNPQHARFAAEAYTLRTIPMREDLSTLEVLANPPNLLDEQVHRHESPLTDALFLLVSQVRRGHNDVGGSCTVRTRIWHSDWKPRWLIRCVSAALLSFMDKQDPEYPQRKAIEACPPGQVLVCDCRGVQRAGALGDILITRLMVRGVAAFVTDGPMRDAAAVAAIEFPTFCTGSAAPASLAAHFAAAVQDPIACGGVAVFPGDVLVGDPDGVCVIPRGIADDVARDAGEQELMEEFILKRVQDGAPVPGTYPPNEATRAAFEAWRRDRK